jgi:serine/arginine repetitive matrix protein 2
MEEDDDNFLDGVIEFGDGRQYKIQSTEPPPQSSPPPSSHSRSLHHDDGSSSHGDGSAITSNILVSKEERFADDFDRSWPRSKHSPSTSQRDFSAQGHQQAPSFPMSSQAVHSSQESSRVLFNERSNKLEPYSNVHSSHRSSQPPYPLKKGTQSEVSSSPTESRSSRDFPPHGPAQSVQLLQKRGSNDFSPRSRDFTGGFEPGSTAERSWSRDTSRRDDMPLSPHLPGPPFDPKRSRDQYNSIGPSASSSGHRERDRDPGGGSRGTRGSTMGPPPLPSPRGHPKDSGRQIPPHLSMPPPTSPTQRRPLPLESHGQSSTPREPSVPFGQPPLLPTIQSPNLSQVVAVPSVDKLPLLSGISDVDMEEVRKDVMQSAAARAKERRKLEEEAREQERERARRKAIELEEKIKVADIERTKATHLERDVSEAEVCYNLLNIGCCLTYTNGTRMSISLSTTPSRV